MQILTMLLLIGEGAYSEVYKVKRISDGNVYALKKVKMGKLSTKEKENALNEVRILASVNHETIIGYKEAFFEDATCCLCLVMEYADDSDLYQKILKHQKSNELFDEQTIWAIFIQMVRALNILHQRKIFHRDLKSANVFLSKEQHARLGDLNVSKVAKKGLLYTQTGTPYYASPEVWRDQPYDHKSDIWSLGCVLYEMCTLKPPFRANDMNGLYKKVLKGSFGPIGPKYSKKLETVVSKMLQVETNLRPSTQELLEMPEVQHKATELGINLKFDLTPNTKNQIIPGQQMLKLGKEGLLQTIYVPKNLASLSTQLPKQNYTGGNIGKKIKAQPIDSQTNEATALINMKNMSQH